MKKLLILLFAVVLLTACVQYEDGEPVENEAYEKSEQAKKEKEQKKADEQTPEKTIEQALAKVSHADFVEMNGQFSVEPYTLQVEYKGTENLTQKMTTKGMKMAIRDALYAVKESELNMDNVRVSIKYPLVDQHGKSSDEYVIKSSFSGETINKLTEKKSEFDSDNLPNIADSWWEHDAIK